MKLNVNGASSGQANEQSETGLTHGSLALHSQSHSATQQSGKSNIPNGTSGSNCQSTTGNYQTPLGSR